jgi:membrane-associated protein
MGFLGSMMDVFLHLDVYLQQLATEYGVWIYAILFAVLFAETGLVVTPFLPGDSLLLTAGVLAGGGVLSLPILWGVCVAGAVIGDSVNYWIGRLAGHQIVKSGIVKVSYVDRTAEFFEKHGGKTIFIARFFPIIRTFAPFMAGMGAMHYPRFLLFSVTGTLLWVTLFVGSGALFGQIAWVRENLEFGVMLVLALSLMPAVYHFFQSRRAQPESAE